MSGGAGLSPRLAVVVITRNRLRELTRSLEQLSRLPERPTLVVVDNGSRDGTAEYLRRRFPEVRVAAIPVNAGAAARNVGVRIAGCEFVAFADDDSWWLPGSLESAADIMEADRSLGLLSARVLVGPEGRPDPACEAMAAGLLGPDLQPRLEGLRAVTGFVACGSVVRSRAFLSVGGFPPHLGVGGEEQTVAWDLWSAGWRLLYEPGIVAVHFPSPSRDPAFRRSMVARNDLLAGWGRLPSASAVRRTARILSAARRDPATAVGVVRAVGAARTTLARRVAIPDRVERARQVLEVA